ncbi:hypothetical protein AB0C77_12865 [Streptomyces sp. NPDC048629]|uniref:hypothetical protein n=1 Tax=Streptomyces sp. NPDC048629 TaxID=3154824 RepID=UPI003413626B
MDIYRVKWTRADGVRRTSVVSFDRPSAEDRVERLAAQGDVTDVEIVTVKPSQ